MKPKTEKLKIGTPKINDRRYGYTFEGWNVDEMPYSLLVELICYRDLDVQYTGVPKWRHLLNASQMLWKDRLIHDWTIWRMKKFCEYDVMAWDGCGGSAKTDDAALLAFLYWAADPKNTIVVLVSTTAQMARKRIWSVFTNLYYTAHMSESIFAETHMVNSKTMLQSIKGNDKFGVFVKAVEDGNSDKVLAELKGMHAPRMMLYIDEGDEVREEILAATANWRSSPCELKILSSSNPIGWNTTHGKLANPVGGKSAIDSETLEWETVGIPKYFIPPGVCLHFDATKSPNIIGGENKFPFLPTKEYCNQVKNVQGHGEDSIYWWRYVKGFRAPEGATRTLFSEALINHHDGRGKLEFITQPTIIAALDPGYGGDNCVLRFAAFGDIAGGKRGIQLTDEIVVPIVAEGTTKNMSIARYVKDACMTRGCFQSNLIIDVTGEGRGTADMIDEIWSDGRVDRCQFSEAPSDMIADEVSGRVAKEVYDRKVTELYYSVRRFLMAGLLKGLSDREITEFCSREYEGDEGKTIKLDKKEDTKRKLGHSPDFADACALIVEKARRLGARAITEVAKRENKTWKKLEIQVAQETDFKDNTFDESIEYVAEIA